MRIRGRDRTLKAIVNRVRKIVENGAKKSEMQNLKCRMLKISAR